MTVNGRVRVSVSRMRTCAQIWVYVLVCECASAGANVTRKRIEGSSKNGDVCVEGGGVKAISTEIKELKSLDASQKELSDFRVIQNRPLAWLKQINFLKLILNRPARDGFENY